MSVVSSQPTKAGKNVFELESAVGGERYKNCFQRCMRDMKCYKCFGECPCQCICCGLCMEPEETKTKIKVQVTEGNNPGGQYITLRVPKDIVKWSCATMLMRCLKGDCRASTLCGCCFDDTGEESYSFLASEISAVESLDDHLKCKQPMDPYCCCCWCFPSEDIHTLAIYLNNMAGGFNPFLGLEWNGMEEPTLREGFENCKEPNGAATTLRNVLMRAKSQWQH